MRVNGLFDNSGSNLVCERPYYWFSNYLCPAGGTVPPNGEHRNIGKNT